MSKAFYKNKINQKHILRERIPTKSGNDQIDSPSEKIPTKSGNIEIDYLNERIPKSFYKSKNFIPKRKNYSNFLDELNLIERIWRELYSKNKNFSYSYGINFYINFLRNHSKFIDLQGATKLRNLELPFICNQDITELLPLKEFFKTLRVQHVNLLHLGYIPFKLKKYTRNYEKNFVLI